LPADWDAERDVLVWVAAEAQLDGWARGPRTWVYVPEPGGVSAPSSATTNVLRSPGELFQALLNLVGPRPAHVLVQRSDGIARDVHELVAATVRNALRALAMQRRTLEESGVTWLLQGLANLPLVAQLSSIAPLARSCAGFPCVLVSPGPSLTRNVERLGALARHALILSGTHALHALHAAGVTPHLVLCADPGDLARHWEGLDLSSVEAFVVGATCRPETFAVPARRRLVFASNGPSDEWLFGPLGEQTGLATGGSVSCSLLSLAVHLGCDPIVFVGQDLSFTDRFYAASGLDGDARVEAAEPGSTSEFVLMKDAGAQGPGTTLADGRVRFTIPQRVLEVPGWNGGSVRTTAQLKCFLDWFAAVVPGLRSRARILNCTEGGARIDGMEHVRLAEASAAWRRPLEVGPLLDRSLAGFDPRERRRILCASTTDMLQALETCLRLTRSCRAQLARAAGAQGDAARGAELEKLGRAEKELSRALRGAPLVSLVAQADIARATEQARRARSLDENLAAARTLYAVVERAGALLCDPLRAARAALAPGGSGRALRP